jgi:hypothetical protein
MILQSILTPLFALGVHMRLLALKLQTVSNESKPYFILLFTLELTLKSHV